MSNAPSNFSWVSDSVAGFAFPHSKENLDYLVNNEHITHLITLNYDKPYNLESFPSLKQHFYPTDEFTSGDVDKVREIVGVIADAEKKGEKCGVHCEFGQMRTGTILAAYLAYHEGLSGKEAIKRICQMRPSSSFSSESQLVVCKYAKSLHS